MGFGCVFYEMVTGGHPFEGDAVTAVLAAVIKSEPEWDTLPSGLPPVLVTYVQRCLQKNPREHIGDMRLALQGAFAATAQPEPAVVPPLRVWQHPLPVVGLVMLATLVTGFTVRSLIRPVPSLPTRFPIVAPDGALLDDERRCDDCVDVAVRIAPDGRAVAFTGTRDGQPQVYIRRLDQLGAVPVRGTEGGFAVGFSPDVQSLLFSESSQLQSVPVAGGPPTTITDNFTTCCASWGPDDVIVFGLRNGGLWEVSAAGGEPVSVTATGGSSVHAFPDVLPNGAGVLFTVSTVATTSNDNQIAVLDRATGAHRVIIERGGAPRYVDSGHIVYAVAGVLYTIAFDQETLEVAGAPSPVVENVSTISYSGATAFDVANIWALVYVNTTGSRGERRTLVWVDRDGIEEPIALDPADYFWARVSPDGSRLVFDVREQDEKEVWVADLRRPGSESKVTTDPAVDEHPVWTPDGEQVVFLSNRDGQPGLFQKVADGSGEAKPLLTVEGANYIFPFGWTPDDRMLLVGYGTLAGC